MSLPKTTILALSLISSASFAIDSEQTFPLGNFEVQKTTNEPLNISTRVLNGNDVSSKDFTHYAMLIEYIEGNNYYNFTCGGSVVNDSFILTAAHCVDRYKNTDTLKVVTKNQSSRSIFIDEFRTVKAITVHPNYVGANDAFINGDDIAVIELNYPILDNISSMRLALEQDTVQALDSEKLTVIGNGLINNFGASATLQQGEVFSISNDACNGLNPDEAFNEVICVTSIIDEMADEDALSQSCSGDSGGPLHYFDENSQRYQQIGLVSYGEEGCQFSSYASIYTKVSHYNEWLTSIITYGNELTYDATIEDGNTRSTGEMGTFIENDGTSVNAGESNSSGGGGSTTLFSVFLLALITLRRKIVADK